MIYYIRVGLINQRHFVVIDMSIRTTYNRIKTIPATFLIQKILLACVVRRFLEAFTFDFIFTTPHIHCGHIRCRDVYFVFFVFCFTVWDILCNSLHLIYVYLNKSVNVNTVDICGMLSQYFCLYRRKM